MLNSTSGILIFLGYAAFIIILVVVTKLRNETAEDFLVMDRKLGLFRGSLSMAVSWIWAPAVFICSLKSFTQGLPSIFWFTLPNVDKPQPNRNDLTLKQRDASHQASESS